MYCSTQKSVLFTGLALLASVAFGQNLQIQSRQNPAFCVDVADGPTNGHYLHLWQCAQGNSNQLWWWQGPLIQTSWNKCIDLTNWDERNGNRPQVWDCNGDQWNQWWEQVGNNIRLKGTNKCLDITNGNIANGAAIQVWDCDFNSPNQALQIVQPGGGGSHQQASNSVPSSSSFCGYNMISWDQFKSLHPVIGNQAWTGAFVDAGSQYNIPPQLLGAIALQESSGNPNVNEAGLMQFTWPATFLAFSNGKDLSARTNPWDAIWAAANYIRDLLNNNGNDLNAALRSYNGEIVNGGIASYQDDIRAWLSGALLYGDGV